MKLRHLEQLKYTTASKFAHISAMGRSVLRVANNYLDLPGAATALYDSGGDLSVLGNTKLTKTLSKVF